VSEGSLARAIAGTLLGILARAWLSTLRVRVIADPALDAAGAGARPWVLSFFHGTQWPLLAWRRRGKTVVLVSLSADGAIQSRALAWQGFTVVRGSSSRGGARGLAALVRAMRGRGSRDGHDDRGARGRADAAFAVDGPKGPYGVTKPGAVVAAKATGAWLVPMGSAITRGIVLDRAWDQFAIAWPFTRVVVTLGAPIDPSREDARGELEAAIARANLDARRALVQAPAHAHEGNGTRTRAPAREEESRAS
jgi:hypothetical protein